MQHFSTVIKSFLQQRLYINRKGRKKEITATQTLLANFIKKQIYLSILTLSSLFPTLKFILFLFSLIDFDFTAIFVILQKENQKK